MPVDELTAWHAVSRLGEAQILLPAAVLTAVWLAWRLKAAPTALAWMGWLGGVAAVTTVSKLAFIGWGIGLASLDFTGFSGHAMFSAAIFPVLARVMSVNRPPATQRLAVALGFGVALLVAVSRVQINAHSVSEIVAGGLLGALASGLVLWLHPLPSPHTRSWLPVLLLAWLVILPWRAPKATTHDMVTQLAIKLANRAQPFMRGDLHIRPSTGSDANVKPNQGLS